MPVTIKTVQSRKELKDFVKFPLSLYKDCPYYVPGLYSDELATLDPARNPMAKYADFQLFLAYKDGAVVGRVAAIINRIANKAWDHAEVRFGWIDFIDDMEVSRALLEAVISYGKAAGMTSVAGPLGFTDFDSEGCVVEGFDDISSFALKFNYPYYAKHFEALQMEKVNDWLELRIYIPSQTPEKVVRAAKLVSERYDLHMKKVTRRDIKAGNYGHKLFDLINLSYSGLFDFTVLPPDVVDKYIGTYLGMLDLDYVTLVEDKEGNLVAAALTMPSIARAVQKGGGYLFPLGWWHILKSAFIKHEEALELLLIAVHPDYRNRGVHAMLFNEIIPNLIKGGFKYGESNAEMETNNAVQNLWNGYEKEFKRRRRVYGKSI